MNDFCINGIKWQIKLVAADSNKLFRSDGSKTVGMTDWNTCTVYIADNLQERFYEKVLCHELCHCICFSYDIKMSIDEEENLAEWVSRYGRKVIELLDDLLYKTYSKQVK